MKNNSDSPSLIDKVRSGFLAEFSGEPLFVKASGRINLIGEHVDYNDGFVLPAAIDKGIVTGVSQSGSSLSQVISLDYDESFQFSLGSISGEKGGGWKDYLLGVVNELIKRELPIGNFNMVFSGDIPSGSGLSSSAALENSIVFSLNELFSLGLDRQQMAIISQAAEHNYVGVKCGIMDQYASIFGTKDHFLLLDCRSLEVAPFQLELGQYQLLLINTNVKHSLTDSAYNERRQVCEKVSEMIGKKALRDCTKTDLNGIRDKLTDSEHQKALFVIQEIERVGKAVECIKNSDIKALGELLFASHDGLQNMYEVSCEELDFLVDLAKADENVLGARMMGGGFGGCTINLLRKEAQQDFIEKTEQAYQKKFGIDCTPITVTISDGTYLINT